MKLLLDTHAVIWWFLGEPGLSRAARTALEDGANRLHASAASAFEISTKFRIGKLPEAVKLAGDFERMASEQEMEVLAVSARHALTAGALPFAHRDPFDRLLIAQAMLEDMVLVSNEKLFDGFGVRRLW